MYLQILVMYRWAPCMDLPTLRLLGRWWDAKITCLKAPGVSVQRRVWCFYSRGRWNLRVHERWNITTWTRGKFLGKYSHPMEPLGVALYWLFSRDPYDSLHIIITPIVLGSISSPKKNKKTLNNQGPVLIGHLRCFRFYGPFGQNYNTPTHLSPIISGHSTRFHPALRMHCCHSLPELQFWGEVFTITRRIHVWHIFLHLVDYHGKCW